MLHNPGIFRRCSQVVGPLAVVGLGFLGPELFRYFDELQIVVVIGGMLGVWLLIFGAVKSAFVDGKTIVGPVALFVYILVVLPFEPFWMNNDFDLFRSIVFLIPIILGSVIFPGRNRWLEAVGCWIILASAVATLFCARTSPFPVTILTEIRY